MSDDFYCVIVIMNRRELRNVRRHTPFVCENEKLKEPDRNKVTAVAQVLKIISRECSGVIERVFRNEITILCAQFRRVATTPISLRYYNNFLLYFAFVGSGRRAVR